MHAGARDSHLIDDLLLGTVRASTRIIKRHSTGFIRHGVIILTSKHNG